MALQTVLKAWERKKAPEAKKPPELKNVTVTERKGAPAAKPPEAARFLAEVRIPGR